MEQKNSPTINFSSSELKDIKSFCKLNEIDIDEFVKECFNQGYQIEKYGMLNSDGVKVIEKEVIKEIKVEVPVETIVEKEIIKEVLVEVEKIVEIPVDKLIEVPVEIEKVVEVEIPVEVIKEIYITDDEQVNELGGKLAELEKEKQKFSTKLTEMENIFQEEKDELLLKIQQLESQMSKKDESLDELRRTLDIELVKSPVEVKVENKEKINKLQDTISKMRDDLREKDEKILQIEKNVLELEKIKGPMKGVFMGTSNLNDNLYR